MTIVVSEKTVRLKLLGVKILYLCNVGYKLRLQPILYPLYAPSREKKREMTIETVFFFLLRSSLFIFLKETYYFGEYPNTSSLMLKISCFALVMLKYIWYSPQKLNILYLSYDVASLLLSG